ncbi:MAG: MFS transporter [Aquificaceae bacterium]|jgi:MFS family permease|uniref:MFS transporter n=1 Tax=Hydrogenobacter sp. Uz 6-8 TaxID=3384828 RepID=UPI0030A220FA
MLKDFTPQERKVVLSITFAVMVRMLGLFLLLPVLSPYLKTLEGATPQLIGLAIGIYGLAQAILQIPFGYLSDRHGRKPVILVGMLTYALGSLMAGLVSNIWSMVFARFLQGFGAVSSAMIALSADLTREEVRTRAFAHIGASIGLTFALSLTIAPVLAGKFGVPFLFFLTAFLSLLATAVLMLRVPEPSQRSKEREINPSLKNITMLLTDKNQLFLNLSIALTHAFMVVIFTVVPYELVYLYHFPKLRHWEIYLPTILLALAFMVPMVILAEKRGRFREVFMLGVLLLGLSFISFALLGNFLGIVLMVLFFFMGFNLLEALVPSLLTKLTHRDLRGLSLGFFNTTQFLGAFAGGLWGGYVLKHGYSYMTVIAILAVLIWFVSGLLWFNGLKIHSRLGVAKE